ncbi:primase-like protein [Ancylomarina subtilis]|uniref:Primase-like protein n=1 Tax=Ancylomarina subtilis TaxID=1639035 RepID=A0A4Q7VIM5_9BACT|nr:DUF3987 domain-containing protein [Ancylomarina subtilis]RZT96010.1 primase-like protein [Ancylomarina subtilis]
MKKIFKPQEWLNIDDSTDSRKDVARYVSNPTKQITDPSTDAMPCVSDTDIEQITQRIESSQTDLTADYADWRDIGFALADELAESGRDYFHRLSRFNTDYASDDCNTQYDNCLKAKGHGITIKTLFHLAKSAGINISIPISSPNLGEVAEGRRGASVINSEVIFNTPNFPAHIYTQLPEILIQSTDMFQDATEKDVFLIGSIAVLSACLANIEGIYFDEPVSPHLYAFITAPAGSGKGKLKWAKAFGQEIHKHVVQQSMAEYEEFEREMEDYNNLNKTQRQGAEKPKQPKRKMFFIPANSSSSAFIQALADNDFKGLIFETEADTLAGTLKQEWGNFSDILRKAFHHESTNMFRRKDNEHIEIEDPHLAIALSGTPKQVHNMMPDVENGLFSRFLYYAFEDYSDFKNPFISHRSVNYVAFFEEKGKRIFELNQMLSQEPKPISFKFSQEQGVDFTEQFKVLFTRNKMMVGNDFNANSRRLGLVTFRIAMVLSALRILETGDISNPIICTQTDYQTALGIVFTLEKHALAVFQNLPNNKLKGAKLKFFDTLPEEFNRQGYLETANKLGIKDKTAEKYITQFREANLLTHEHNAYTKNE